MTIHKYYIDPVSGKTIMPIGAKLLTIKRQNKKPYVWSLVDQIDNFETRIFKVYNTGEDMDNTARNYITTLFDGDFVWHVFEEFPV